MSVFTFNHNLCDTPNIIFTVPACHDTCSQPSYIIRNFYIEEVTIKGWFHNQLMVRHQRSYSCFVVSPNRILFLGLRDSGCSALVFKIQMWSLSLTLRYFQLIIESNQSISAVKLFIEHILYCISSTSNILRHRHTTEQNSSLTLQGPTPEHYHDGSWCQICSLVSVSIKFNIKNIPIKCSAAAILRPNPLPFMRLQDIINTILLIVNRQI